MNCQEYKGMIEDALDVSLRGELKANVLRHLEHCPDCRNYYARRRQEHSALFMSINAAYAHSRPPPAGFADRLMREVTARRAARRAWWRVSLPRWALIAASLAIIAGFVFAANVVIDAVTTTTDDGGRGMDTLPSTNYQLPTTNYQLSINQGETTMTGKKAATAALASAMAAAPLTAARGDGYQYILSGDPVAAETARSSSASSATVPLTSGTLADGYVHASELEARSRTAGESAVMALRSDKFSATLIIFK